MRIYSQEAGGWKITKKKHLMRERARERRREEGGGRNFDQC
jgi:hypothetical protein